MFKFKRISLKGRSLKRSLVIGFAALAAVAVGAAGAVAVTTTHSATQFHNFASRTETNAWTGAGTAWTDVPNTHTSIYIPAGQYRKFHATFTAESQCSGGGWCSIRLVLVRPNGSWVALHPQSDTDFAFDSPGGSPWQSNSVARTSDWQYANAAGYYRIKAQAARIAGSTGFRLDDYTIEVNAYR